MLIIFNCTTGYIRLSSMPVALNNQTGFILLKNNFCYFSCPQIIPLRRDCQTEQICNMICCHYCLAILKKKYQKKKNTNLALQESWGGICCTETNLHKAWGQAEGEQIDRLRRAKERVCHKYARERTAWTGQEHHCLIGPQHWFKEKTGSTQTGFLFIGAKVKTASLHLTSQQAEMFWGIWLAEWKRRGKGKEKRASTGSQEWKE